ncbi:hypothetical protein F4821DRAFT_263769 [Hypoxylon rubiginosum]|uniref:Uncharacterized protein n=1 Tax=Hypoxylon rubiginosum TaxID=110542 RepID=A0ACC0CQ86_9PEZI|nr:hypothetical protein F4821DRAFT_263769 [Hypoxylon rubiginosum]
MNPPTSPPYAATSPQNAALAPAHKCEDDCPARAKAKSMHLTLDIIFCWTAPFLLGVAIYILVASDWRDHDDDHDKLVFLIRMVLVEVCLLPTYGIPLIRYFLWKIATAAPAPEPDVEKGLPLEPATRESKEELKEEKHTREVELTRRYLLFLIDSKLIPL